MRDDSDEFNEPYLPARYRETVRKKRQRRLLKKAGTIVLAVIALLAAYILLSGFLTGSPQPAPAPTPAATPLQTTVASTPAATIMPAAIPFTTAIPTTRMLATLTADTPVTATDTPQPVLTARAGTGITPSDTASPKITENQAKSIALAAFPDLPAGEMLVELSASPDFGPAWKYTLHAGTITEASGFLDADTGRILTFSRTIHPGARPVNPVLTLGNARQIADDAINSRNSGILPINMSDSRFVPLVTPGGNVAGSYRFIYDRIVQDYPCDADGFVVSVDAVSGAITEYVHHWQTPDNAFMLAETPMVPRFDAIYTVQAQAKVIYPSSISGLRIISADVRWKDRHDPATIPRPSTIQLAWKVVFDDEIIRAKADPVPSVGWVDIQTGELIALTYRH